MERKQIEKIQVVLASPSDLAEERKMIQELINSFNPLYMKHNICFDLRMWENVTAGMNANGPQGVIDVDLEIPQADVFICMYWKKSGTIIPKENVAGTEHELNLALESYHQRRKPDIKAYFKSYDSSEECEDTRIIKEIAKRLQPLGLYTPFSSLDELRVEIEKVLQSEVMKRMRNLASVVPDIRKYVEVSDTESLINNITANSKLVLNKGYYDILNFNENTSHASKRKVFDGMELVISDVSDITIVGDNSTLLVSPRYANVITFSNCSDIKLIGLTLGHTPRKGVCAGSVLRFEKCSNVQLDSLELFGCGTYGIELYECVNVKVNGTKIFECTYGALSVMNSNLEFSNSMIYDCNKIDGCLIEAYNSELDFNNVSIYNNYIENYLISLNSSTMFCNGVCVYCNSFSALCNEEIPWGIYLDDNAINSIGGYYVTVSSKTYFDRQKYNEYKEAIRQYGEIVECIYEEGMFSISMNCFDYSYYEKLSVWVEADEKITMTCG